MSSRPRGVGDGGVEGEPVYDGRGTESFRLRTTKRRRNTPRAPVDTEVSRAASSGVARDGDAGAFFAFGEHLEQQFRAAAIEFEISEFVEAEQVDAAVAGYGFGQVLVVGGLDELVDQRGGGDVADLEPGLRGGGPEPDEQVGLPVSSTINRPSSDPRCSVAYSRRSARIPSSSQTAFRSRCCNRAGLLCPTYSAIVQQFLVARSATRPRNRSRAVRRGSTRVNRAPTRTIRSSRCACRRAASPLPPAATAGSY